MNIYYLSILVASVLMIVGCKPATTSNSPRNDTWRLDSMAQRDSQSADFARRVEVYYQALQKKDWPTSYDMRTANYKQLVTEDTYLRQITEEKGWNLDSYKILNVAIFGDKSGDHAAQLIIETSENGSVYYNCAVWKYVGGIWLCEEPGIDNNDILHSMTPPDWYKN